MSDTWQIFVVLVSLLLAGYAVYRSYQSGHAITLSNVAETLHEVQPTVADVKEVVQIAVDSAEQLKREGKITNEQAFNHALDLAKKWIPKEWQVDNEDIINAINAAVLVASALSKQAGTSTQNASGTTKGVIQ